jgi:hypothetical protein
MHRQMITDRSPVLRRGFRLHTADIVALLGLLLPLAIALLR